MRNRTLITFMILFSFIIINMSCSDKATTAPKPTGGKINGVVNNSTSSQIIINHECFIFCDDSLVATTTNDGSFSVSITKDGTYHLLCSSLGYLDATAQVEVNGGKTTIYNFTLTPDTRKGRIYGEFQDMNLFVEKAAAKPELNTWNGKEIWESVTGATLQSQTLQYLVPERRVILGDSVLKVTDDFAQYWFELQQGTYYLKATCEGYKSTGKVVHVYPDSVQYVNFYLYRE
ncbi:MAG TPA: hypothetical protein PLP19_14615 [bacterium]|nr:hypothetical protein [bacterium]HPN44724.1 hypothetical protein [bacterium]